MIEFFFNGGFVFMGILTLILLFVVIISVIVAISIFIQKINNTDETLREINYIRSAGIFAVFFGIFGQLIGLFSAFKAIKLDEVDISYSFIAEGFRISMITTIYGILIFSFSMLIWFVLKKALEKIEL
ncbi:MotA/TolQ/ExbB proton channel family protein [Yeosuana marina]|uniref:MotA/TolQ/ExbB proton channel family protein n=1 Tax=Yeosuana marina TaxID=1565536 RepID=UPI0030EB6B70|tara:strand:+ start:2054 stop:2437 length:384 start_codon:yes stop_codon:yes gene_type:complete